MPFRTVFFSMAVLWAAYFVLITVRSFVIDYDPAIPMDYAHQFEMMWRRAIVSVAGLALTVALWGMLRLFDRRALWIKITAALVLAIPIAMAIGKINHSAFKDLQMAAEQKYAEKNGINMRRDESGNLLVDIPVKRVRPADSGEEETIVDSESVIIAKAQTASDVWKAVLDIALGRYFLLLAWASLYFALLAGHQARAAERREQEFRSAAKAAELRSLRYQVNPHFLFNTLNSLSALVITGKPERAEKMIQTMSRFYRHSLADDPTSDVALKDEIDLQRLYLDIEAVRFPERLICEFDLPPELQDARVPGMILQPLIENSVKYAVSPVNRAVTIRVSVREEFDRLVITVSDDGPGVPEGVNHGFGIGLANVRDRLEARFGSDIVLSSGPLATGYSTEMRIPLTYNG
ncbi:MAG: histidine kinase [Pseudomonadota bacterium]